MALRNTETRFGWPARLLHWLTVLLLTGSFGLGLSMVDLDFSPTKLQMYSWHKWIGVTIFGLTALRVIWRLVSPAPPLPETMGGVQRALAHLSHFLLYVLLVALPLSGWLMSSALGLQTVYLGMWPLPDLIAADRDLGETLETVHWALGRLFLALIALHILAALYHHFLIRDDVLRRMRPW